MDVAGDGISDRVISVINDIRASLGLPGVLNAFSESSNDNVFRTTLTITLGDDFGDDMETATIETLKELLNSDSPRRPEAVGQRGALLSKFATHMDVISNNKLESEDMSLRIEVFFKYLELSGVGPVIDGDLVVQGTCLSPTHSPAVCKVEFAADHEEVMVDAVTIAPWLMMYIPSANPHEANSEFTVPITLGVEHREGHVRVRIYVEQTESIPYGEESNEYLEAFAADTKGERFVCAIEFTTRASILGGLDSGANKGLSDGLDIRSVAGEGFDIPANLDRDGFIAEMGNDPSFESSAAEMKSATPGGKQVMRTRRSPSVHNQIATQLPVVIDIKVAIGFDDVGTLRSEGYQLSCIHLGSEGLKEEDEEGKWSYFIMAKFGDRPVLAAPIPAAAVASVYEKTDDGMTIPEGQEKQSLADTEATLALQSSESIDLVEDVIYVEVPRRATILEEGGDLTSVLIAQGLLPMGYQVLTQDLLATTPLPPSDSTSEGAQGQGENCMSQELCVFVAFKRASSSATSGAITSFGLFSFVQDVETSLLPAYLSNNPDKNLKAAPNSLNLNMGNNCISGILLGRNSFDTAPEEEWVEDEPEDELLHAHSNHAFVEEKEMESVENEKPSRVASRVGSIKGDDEEGFDVDDENYDEDDEEEEEKDEGVVLEKLLAKAEELSLEKEALFNLNADLQRKAAVLIAREKALMQGQTRAGTAPDEAPSGKEEEPQKDEHVQEREKHFSDILSHVVEARKKASQQQLEYDQLALDLQTRLDDRNFKAGEIYESFKAFKKEILTKAENSRTSKPMSKRLIKQFEAAEQQREEDLERVRLRNISMRTQLKKMEKTLRAREQLAEGLYMIDFEQLKVENQTLYEKIEERSEELVKLKRKKTITVQMLTHVREKLRFIENVSFYVLSLPLTPQSVQQQRKKLTPICSQRQANIQLNSELTSVENLTMGRRGDVTDVKKQRDLVREENKELRLKQGFSSSSGLKSDFDGRKGALEDIKAEINELRARYDMLARTVSSINTTALIPAHK